METLFVNFVDLFFGFFLVMNALVFIPQIINLLRNKHANDISLITFTGFNMINIFSVLHGIIIHDLWLSIGYLFSVATSSITTILIIKYKYFSMRDSEK